MTGKNLCFILLAAYLSVSFFCCAADFRPLRREVGARLPVAGALGRPSSVLPFLDRTCAFSAPRGESTVSVTPANVAALSPFLRPALTTAASPFIAAGLAASMASKFS